MPPVTLFSRKPDSVFRSAPVRIAHALAIFGCCVVMAMAQAALAPPVKNFSGGSVTNLLPANAHALVLFFVSTDCPISNSYAPEYSRVAAEFQPRGFAVRLVYPNKDETAEAIAAHLKDYRLSVEALRDPAHVLCRAAGARVTPEAAVFVRGQGWVYHGRIDDKQVDFGKARGTALTHDLRDVLEKIARGETVKPYSTRSVGCYISDLQ
jgi:hypothetical protein